jgi:hypothetical protein
MKSRGKLNTNSRLQSCIWDWRSWGDQSDPTACEEGSQESPSQSTLGAQAKALRCHCSVSSLS